MKRKIFTLLTALTLSASALFASETAVDGIYYDFDDATLTAQVTYRGSSYDEYTNEYTGDVVIPESVTCDGKTYSVTSIGIYAFDGCSGLTSVTIPNSVTSIGSGAFYGCIGLTSITIPNSVESIGSYAFYNCSGLTSVTIPNSVTSIGDYAFRGCSGLTSVTIPNSVTSIGEEAFDDVPNIVYNGTAIGSPWGARSVNGYIEWYLVYKSEAKTQLLACYSTATGEITIPSSVTSIGDWAFKACSGLTSITIPNSVTSIGDWAFSSCSGLTEVTIPNSVESIGSYAFYNCSGLTSIVVESGNTKYDSRNNCNAIIETATNTLIVGCQSTIIPNSVTSIGVGAFEGCSGLISVTIPNSVESIGSYAFNGCSGLTAVTIPNSVTSIDMSAFKDCSGLTSITIPNSVDSIGEYAFRGCSGLTSVTIPNSVTSIGDGVFFCCSGLNSVTIPNSVTSIGDRVFFCCSGLTSVTIGNSVESIGDWAFSGCSSLTSVTIPNSVDSIGEYAFHGCSGLTSVVWNAKNYADFEYSYYAPFYDIASQITSFTFGDEVEHISACLCSGMNNLTEITIPNSVTSIGSYAFYNCSSLTSVTIPNSVTSIGDGVFFCCSGLTSVVWNAKNCADFAGYYDKIDYDYYYGPFCNIVSKITSFTFGNEVEHIPAYLCYGMENLTSITIPSSVTSIGDHAFEGCSELTSVTIPNSVKSIGDWAFESCSELPSVTIPNSVKSIGEGAFSDCSSLTAITIPNSVTNVGEEAFYGCSNLTAVVWNAKTCKDFSDYSYAPFYDICSQIASFTFGNAVEHIPAYLCSGMENLTAITIPNSVTSIGESAFSGCSEITSISTPNLVKSIEKNTFADCTKLKTVVIGNAVTNIGDGAFYGCDRLLYFTCYAEEPPFVGTDPFSTYNVYLKVPCSGLDAYKMYDVWRNFDYISCIGSEEVEVTEFNVTPSVNDAQFTWPAEPNAATYELVISKDGVVFCTLTFNANGQLMGIAFAPSVNSAETTATSGFQFTVTGLDEASHYTYTFDAKDADGGVIQHYAGEFNTDGYVGLDQIELAGLYTQAGRIVCEGEFRIYDLLGRDVTRLNGSLCGVYVVKVGEAAVKVIVK